MLNIILMILFIVCAILLTLLILIQKGRGGGLAAAFGGGGSQSAFGTKTADVLTKMTAGLALVFFLISVLMAVQLTPKTGGRQTGGAGDAQQTAPDTDTPAGDVPPGAGVLPPTAPGDGGAPATNE